MNVGNIMCTVHTAFISTFNIIHYININKMYKEWKICLKL